MSTLPTLQPPLSYDCCDPAPPAKAVAAKTTATATTEAATDVVVFVEEQGSCSTEQQFATKHEKEPHRTQATASTRTAPGGGSWCNAADETTLKKEREAIRQNDLEELLWDACDRKNLEQLRELVERGEATLRRPEQTQLTRKALLRVLGFSSHEPTQPRPPRKVAFAFRSTADSSSTMERAPPTHTNFSASSTSNAVSAVVIYLLQRPGIRVNSLRNEMNGQTILHWAAQQNHVPIIQQLLDTPLLENNSSSCHSILNVGDHHGNTALHVAASEGRIGVVECLARHPQHLHWGVQNQENQTILHAAILHCHHNHQQQLALVQFLLAQPSLPVNAQDSKGKTALHLAMMMWNQQTHSSPALVHALLDHPFIETSLVNGMGETVLHMAIRMNAPLDLIQRLVYIHHDGKKTIRVPNHNLETPLHYALVRCNPTHRHEIMECLLAVKTVDVNAQDRKGDTPLHLAVGLNSAAAVKMLLDHPNIQPGVTNRKNQSPFTLALHPILRSSSGGQFQPQRVSSSDNITAAFQGVLDTPPEPFSPVLQHLLTHPAVRSVNVRDGEGNTILQTALRSRQMKVVNFLLDHQPGIIPSITNQQGETALHFAIRIGASRKVVLRLAEDPDTINVPNHRGETPLHYAVIQRKSTALKTLLSHQTLDVNACDRQGDTALHFAIRNRQLEHIDLLLEHPGVDQAIVNHDGETVLHLAIRIGGWALVERLAQNPVTINQTNRYFETPLHYALTRSDAGQRCAMATCLLSQEAINVNAQDFQGNTALHCAVQNHELSIVNLLLQHPDTDPTLTNWKGETVVHAAIPFGERDRTRIDIFHDRNLVTRHVQQRAMLEVALLPNHAIDVNAQDRQGNTALHVACRLGRLDLVQVLMERRGIKSSLPNLEGKKAIEVTNIPAISDHILLMESVHLSQSILKGLEKAAEQLEGTQPFGEEDSLVLTGLDVENQIKCFHILVNWLLEDYRKIKRKSGRKMAKKRNWEPGTLQKEEDALSNTTDEHHNANEDQVGNAGVHEQQTEASTHSLEISRNFAPSNQYVTETSRESGKDRTKSWSPGSSTSWTRDQATNGLFAEQPQRFRSLNFKLHFGTPRNRQPTGPDEIQGQRQEMQTHGHLFHVAHTNRQPNGTSEEPHSRRRNLANLHRQPMGSSEIGERRTRHSVERRPSRRGRRRQRNEYSYE